DLDIGQHRPVLADRVENAGDGAGLHQRRRAAAKEDARHGAAWNALGGRGDFGLEGAQESRLVDRGVADMAVEVAVRALRQAERPVHIDAEALDSEALRVSAAQDTPPQA